MTFDSAAAAATWALYDSTGLRPEYVIPVWESESGLDPSRPNHAGLAYYGLNQLSASWLASLGIAPADFLTWTAGEQIARAITPYWQSVIAHYGVPHSATRAFQGNFLPATLATARSLMQIVAAWGTPEYVHNRALDPLGRGAITVADLALWMSKAAASGLTRDALSQVYAQRPAEKMQSPVYGTDFLDPAWGVVAIAAAGASALAAR